jgi:hypothetical protein
VLKVGRERWKTARRGGAVVANGGDDVDCGTAAVVAVGTGGGDGVADDGYMLFRCGCGGADGARGADGDDGDSGSNIVAVVVAATMMLSS